MAVKDAFLTEGVDVAAVARAASPEVGAGASGVASEGKEAEGATDSAWVRLAKATGNRSAQVVIVQIVSWPERRALETRKERVQSEEEELEVEGEVRKAIESLCLLADSGWLLE